MPTPMTLETPRCQTECRNSPPILKRAGEWGEVEVDGPQVCRKRMVPLMCIVILLCDLTSKHLVFDDCRDAYKLTFWWGDSTTRLCSNQVKKLSVEKKLATHIHMRGFEKAWRVWWVRSASWLGLRLHCYREYTLDGTITGLGMEVSMSTWEHVINLPKCSCWLSSKYPQIKTT